MEKNLEACRKCKKVGFLVKNYALKDSSCEACGLWQNEEYNSRYWVVK